MCYSKKKKAISKVTAFCSSTMSGGEERDRSFLPLPLLPKIPVLTALIAVLSGSYVSLCTTARLRHYKFFSQILLNDALKKFFLPKYL